MTTTLPAEMGGQQPGVVLHKVKQEKRPQVSPCHLGGAGVVIQAGIQAPGAPYASSASISSSNARGTQAPRDSLSARSR